MIIIIVDVSEELAISCYRVEGTEKYCVRLSVFLVHHFYSEEGGSKFSETSLIITVSK
jgi:hypothetical protein